MKLLVVERSISGDPSIYVTIEISTRHTDRDAGCIN